MSPIMTVHRRVFIWHEGLRSCFLLLASLSFFTAGCQGRQSNVSTDPTNELPFGWVDIPAPDASVPPSTPIGGWALDDRGIREVRIFVDSHFVNVTPLNTDRPDVAKAYPSYARGSSKNAPQY
jgi:hypothetical protein